MFIIVLNSSFVKNTEIFIRELDEFIAGWLLRGPNVSANENTVFILSGDKVSQMI